MAKSSSSRSKVIHSCTFCGLVLSSANALLEHRRIHTGDRPFACHICNKRFTQKAHLNIHKRTHTGEKPYSCHICHKRFAQSSHLNSHKRVHTGEKPFVCGICHIGFTQKQRLDAHLKKHLEKPGQQITVRQRLFPRGGLSEQCSTSADDLEEKIGLSVGYIKSECDSSSHSHTIYSGDQEFQGQSSAVDNKLDYVIDNNEEVKDILTQPENAGADSDPSFSSEGHLFLHPSGYVAYNSLGDEQMAQQSATHRRKPSVVRKHCSESPVRESPESTSADIQNPDLMKHNSCEMDSIEGGEAYCQGSQRRVRPLNPKVQRTMSRPSANRNNWLNFSKPQLRSSSSMVKQAGDTLELRHCPASVKSSQDKLSLADFTAEELVVHMMKREDVHKCQFCCIIFQDAAMFHIHRNMHEKADIRQCNMCGKVLQDKYDFTAHFLTTHQN